MKKKAVIIDDSIFLIKHLSSFLEEAAGLEVVATGRNGAEAVELYRAHHPDLLALDITMPDSDGKTALGQILDEFPDARVLIVSAVRGDAVIECMTMGAKGYIEKPLRLTDPEFVKVFLETIEEVLA